MGTFASQIAKTKLLPLADGPKVVVWSWDSFYCGGAVWHVPIACEEYAMLHVLVHFVCDDCHVQIYVTKKSNLMLPWNRPLAGAPLQQRELSQWKALGSLAGWLGSRCWLGSQFAGTLLAGKSVRWEASLKSIIEALARRRRLPWCHCAVLQQKASWVEKQCKRLEKNEWMSMNPYPITHTKYDEQS